MESTNKLLNSPSFSIFKWINIFILLLGLTSCGGGSDEQSHNEFEDESSDDSEFVSNSPATPDFTLLAANDLGMHCADLDYQVFSILPPFNVVHAQVIKTGNSRTPPRILDDQAVKVTYAATSNPKDPAGSNSINMTSENVPGVFKGNFWANSGESLPFGSPNFGANYTQGGLAYAPLYPNAALAGTLLEPPQDFASLCTDPGNRVDCPSALSLYEPLGSDRGLPVPDLLRFYPTSADPVVELFQQSMPGPSNTPQVFARFDRDLPFYVNFGFGSRLGDVNWFAAEGIPIMPVDDAGRSNSYPLMRVSATSHAPAVESPWKRPNTRSTRSERPARTSK